MGEILSAACPCGFRSANLFVGCGMVVMHARVPVACPQCHTIWTEDERRLTRHCRKGHAGAYSLYETDSFTPPDVLETDAAHPRSTPEVRYRCPRCAKMEMQLIREGYWD
jgi:hypothetical protein